MNKVILIGRLTRDPEMQYTPSGVAVTKFTLAVDRPRQKDKETETDFINIVAWRSLAELCANYLRKGSLAALEGRLQIRNYDNSEGKKVYVTEVIAEQVRFLGGAGKQEAQDPFEEEGKPIDLNDDDLPF